MMRIRYALAFAVLVAAPVSTPARAATDGGIWDGTQHQPTESATIDQEKAAGIAPPARQQNQTTDTLEQIDRTLTNKSKAIKRRPPP